MSIRLNQEQIEIYFDTTVLLVQNRGNTNFSVLNLFNVSFRGFSINLTMGLILFITTPLEITTVVSILMTRCLSGSIITSRQSMTDSLEPF